MTAALGDISDLASCIKTSLGILISVHWRGSRPKTEWVSQVDYGACVALWWHNCSDGNTWAYCCACLYDLKLQKFTVSKKKLSSSNYEKLAIILWEINIDFLK